MKLEQTEPRFERGEAVTVHEENIAPWSGVVTALKFSPVSGWWIEIRRGDEGTWHIQENDVQKEEA